MDFHRISGRLRISAVRISGSAVKVKLIEDTVHFSRAAREEEDMRPLPVKHLKQSRNPFVFGSLTCETICFPRQDKAFQKSDPSLYRPLNEREVALF